MRYWPLAVRYWPFWEWSAGLGLWSPPGQTSQSILLYSVSRPWFSLLPECSLFSAKLSSQFPAEATVYHRPAGLCIFTRLPHSFSFFQDWEGKGQIYCSVQFPWCFHVFTWYVSTHIFSEDMFQDPGRCLELQSWQAWHMPFSLCTPERKFTL